MRQKTKDKIKQNWLDGKIDDDLYQKYQSYEQEKEYKKLLHENDSILTKIKRHAFLIIFSIIVLLGIALYTTARLMTPEQFSKFMTHTINMIATNPITIIIVLIIFAPILLSGIFAPSEKPDKIVRFTKNSDGSVDAKIFKKGEDY